MRRRAAGDGIDPAVAAVLDGADAASECQPVPANPQAAPPVLAAYTAGRVSLVELN